MGEARTNCPKCGSLAVAGGNIGGRHIHYCKRCFATFKHKECPYCCPEIIRGVGRSAECPKEGVQK